jgi:hypothetical protein
MIPLPTVDQEQALGYDAIRYIPGFPASYVKNYAEAYAAACVAEERERCIRIAETYAISVGNSRAGELAAEWTMDNLREVRDQIRAGGDA